MSSTVFNTIALANTFNEWRTNYNALVAEVNTDVLRVNGPVVTGNVNVTGTIVSSTVKASTTLFDSIAPFATTNVALNATTLIVGANVYVNGTMNVIGLITVADITITGNLTVSGTTTYINTTNLQIGDNILTLNADLGAIAPTENAGLEINRGTSANVTFRWNETSDVWEYTTNGSTYAALGTLANTTISGLVSNTTQSFEGVKTFVANVVVNGIISGNGISITSLNASSLATGTVSTARLGSGTANSTTFLAGDSSWKSLTNSSKPFITLIPNQNQPPSTSYATPDVRNDRLVLDFDPSSNESAMFVTALPAGYSGNTVRVTIHWMSTSNTTGDVVWAVTFESLAGLDLDTNSFATAQTVVTTASSTNGNTVTSNTDFTSSDIDGLLASGLFRLKITRNASVAGDTMDSDAEVVAVVIQEL